MTEKTAGRCDECHVASVLAAAVETESHKTDGSIGSAIVELVYLDRLSVERRLKQKLANEMPFAALLSHGERKNAKKQIFPRGSGGRRILDSV